MAEDTLLFFYKIGTCKLFVAQICSSVCPEHYSVLEETDCISGLESRKSFICPATQNLALLVTGLSRLNAHSISESTAVEHWDVRVSALQPSCMDRGRGDQAILGCNKVMRKRNFFFFFFF